MTSPIDLAGNLVARLCHDLSGQLGTVMGAASMAAEAAGDPTGPAALAAEAANGLARRLRLLRAAWSGDGAGLAAADIPPLAAALSTRPIVLDVAGLAPGTCFGPEAARVLLNVLLLAAEALPRGGLIRLDGAAGGSVRVTIAGQRAAWPEPLATLAAAPDSAWTAIDDPRRLQAPLTILLAREAGMRLALLPGEGDGPAVLLIGGAR